MERELLCYFREWREHAGLSQKAAAQELGIDRSHLSRLETRNPDVRIRYNSDFLLRAASLYQCSIVDLYFHPDDPRLQLMALARDALDDAHVQVVVEIIRIIQSMP